MTVPGGAPDPATGRTRSDQEQPEEHDRPRPPVDKATLDRIFGTVLPEVTRDEISERRGTTENDAWYRENRPPHHG